jgi:hypothetical protein
MSKQNGQSIRHIEHIKSAIGFRLTLTDLQLTGEPRHVTLRLRLSQQREQRRKCVWRQIATNGLQCVSAVINKSKVRLKHTYNKLHYFKSGAHNKVKRRSHIQSKRTPRRSHVAAAEKRSVVRLAAATRIRNDARAVCGQQSCGN